MGWCDMGEVQNVSSSPNVPLSSLTRRQLMERLLISERALLDIVRCDYRGNEPTEQKLARLALAEVERVR
jgi:hypothetical protein